MPRLLILLVPIAALGALLPARSQDTPKPEDFVTVQKGTLPIIISAPHGGRKPIPDLPERKGPNTGREKFVTIRDENTAELTDRLVVEIEKRLGGKPWVVIARFQRKFIDVNRTPQGAYESEKARPYYEAYHGPLAAACKAVKEKFGRGILLDVHGQGLYQNMICRGTRNGKTVTLLKDRFGWGAVNGKDSILGRMEAAGYKIMPRGRAAMSTKEEPNFVGGYIVATYGSHTGYGIDAIQLELGSDLRARQAYAKTARDLADAIAAFHDEYLKDSKN